MVLFTVTLLFTVFDNKVVKKIVRFLLLLKTFFSKGLLGYALF